MRVALGVSGGVAAYKAAELVRKLQQDGIEVQVIMTDSAQEFITPLTFAALTGQKVITEMFGAESEGGANVESAIEHIAVAQRIDLLVIAPATANTIAKMARGIADDFLTTLYLATTAPVVVAPAMNVNMWEHAAAQENVEALRQRGVHIVAPEEGYLACGMTGAGRLASVDAIASAVLARLGIAHDLQEETIVVTAGPTCEDLDPVRFITNRSSGKMGYALATAAARRGANVILISGPTRLDPPQGVQFISVRTTEQMHRAVLENFQGATSLIMAAAVADYRPVTPQTKKMKRGTVRLNLELEPTVDILSDVSRGKANRVIVGFAAETENVAANARAKLESKDADLIVANDVTAEGAGFDHDTNVITLYFRDGSEKTFERMPKIDAAHRILDHLRGLRPSSGNSLEQPAETQRTR
ncbi:MAG TPA: bifunctional phosphopantothenoylcysteine decarboxylase/phosphopantothenate--cysteine ligase CoaBC [Candidatus Acidoferrales bacterium]|jgi:phosphopantothenoylcysteine decarboxylase/phosphopantothenate--cysteine ligase|nr:bifunctional phosphopantothenoylcysteine decarboxylase/phosphopantothenate--cysteine ligase CoaBC [Candidatus Acidoferrales bacterium]